MANIDLSLLDIQQNLVRIVVLVSSVLVLQGLTFLVGVAIWIGNFRAYGAVKLTVDAAKENHPAVTDADESDSS